MRGERNREADGVGERKRVCRVGALALLPCILIWNYENSKFTNENVMRT